MNPLRLPATPRILTAAGGQRLRSVHSAGPSADSRDRTVQQTDQDASQSRLSAVETGYLHDDFASAFCQQKGIRKFPLINRGTFVRTTALDRLVNAFVLSAPATRKQIVSFGAGSDTRYFRLRQTLPPAALASLAYHELDFAAVTAAKIGAILRHGLLPAAEIVAVDEAAGSLDAGGYRIHALDLRALRPGCVPPAGVELAGPPTLFLSECCLVYLAPEEADAIVRWTTADFAASVGIAVYEPVGGDDAFGRVMVRNLAARGIVLGTLERYATLARQRERLRALGYSAAQHAADIHHISETWVDAAEKDRIARLELLDEVEEWRMLARHYCVAWAWRGSAFDVWDGAVPLQPAD